MTAITREEFLEWKENEVTQEFFSKLKVTREGYKENLARGNYDNSEFVVGKATALLDILEMQYEEFMEAT